MVDKTRRFHRQLIHNQQNRIALFKETKKKEIETEFQKLVSRVEKISATVDSIAKSSQ